MEKVEWMLGRKEGTGVYNMLDVQIPKGVSDILTELFDKRFNKIIKRRPHRTDAELDKVIKKR